MNPIPAAGQDTPAVQTCQLTREYRRGASTVRAVRHLDLAVPAGEFLGIVGVSGSGKSTLLHLLGGLDTPTDGSVCVAGQNLGRLSSYERALYRRQVVGFVFQSFHLVPTLTAAGNIRLALTIQGTFGTERERQVTQALQRVDLANRAHHRPAELSGGEQQRVAVARAIVHRPRLLLADEPTGNLDARTAESLLELLTTLNRQAGVTVIMVTHNEPLAERYCHRVLRMSDGQWLA